MLERFNTDDAYMLHHIIGTQDKHLNNVYLVKSNLDLHDFLLYEGLTLHHADSTLYTNDSDRVSVKELVMRIEYVNTSRKIDKVQTYFVTKDGREIGFRKVVIFKRMLDEVNTMMIENYGISLEV